MYVKFLDKMGSDHTVTNAARISFNSSSETLTAKDEKLVKYLADHQHMSPFEHCTLMVEIKCPIYISKQIMRHRTFSYNEVSRRYTSEEIEFYCPKVFSKQATNNRQASDGTLEIGDNVRAQIHMLSHCERAFERYEELLKLGVSREQARGILPQALYTRFVMTGNLRNWAHFVSLRTHPGAQQEVQYLATEIQTLLHQHFPVAARALFEAADP